MGKSPSGNQFFRQLIQHALPIYKEASTKFEKSMIVSEVVDEVRSRATSGGGFVKRKSGIYYEVGDHFAREKVGQSLRDGLPQYTNPLQDQRGEDKRSSVPGLRTTLIC